jgi:hypothetical protein
MTIDGNRWVFFVKDPENGKLVTLFQMGWGGGGGEGFK